MTPAEAKAALERVRSCIDALAEQESETITVQAATVAEAAERRITAFLLATAADIEVPVSLLKPFASYSQFYGWNREKKLTLVKKNRKACVKPSEFFALWATLKN